MSDRSALLRAIREAPDGRTQMQAVAALDAYDRARAAQHAQDRELDMAGQVVASRLYQQGPMNGDRHTAATDWLLDVGESPLDYRVAMHAEAAGWMRTLPREVLADREEFSAQALGASQTLASAYGEHAPAARDAFLSAVAALSAQAASGLPQIDQLIDPNNQPSQTPYPTDVFDNFAPEANEYNGGIEGDNHQSQVSSQNAPMLQQVQQMDGSGSGFGGGPERPDSHTTSFDTSNSYAEVPLGPPGTIPSAGPGAAPSAPSAPSNVQDAAQPGSQGGQEEEDKRGNRMTGARYTSPDPHGYRWMVSASSDGEIFHPYHEHCAASHWPDENCTPEHPFVAMASVAIDHAMTLDHARRLAWCEGLGAQEGRRALQSAGSLRALAAAHNAVAEGWGRSDRSAEDTAVLRGFQAVVRPVLADGKMEAPGCSCCQSRSGSGEDPNEECPKCDHLWKSHQGARSRDGRTAASKICKKCANGSCRKCKGGDCTCTHPAMTRTAAGGYAAGGVSAEERRNAPHHLPGTDKFPIGSRADVENAKHDIGRTSEPHGKVVRYINEMADEYGAAPVGGSKKESSRSRLDFPQAAEAALTKGAPFAGYEDFAACVAANSDKRDPEAYCGKIKHQAEGSLRAEAAWARRHYEDLAQLISAHPQRAEIGTAFARSLRGSNSSYRPTQFLDAATSEGYRARSQAAFPDYGRQHYQHAAHVIHDLDLPDEQKADVARHFAEHFQNLNAHFRPHVFYSHVMSGGSTEHRTRTPGYYSTSPWSEGEDDPYRQTYPTPRGPRRNPQRYSDPGEYGGEGHEPSGAWQRPRNMETTPERPGAEPSWEAFHYTAPPEGTKRDPVFGSRRQAASGLTEIQQTVSPDNVPTPEADQLPPDVMFPITLGQEQPGADRKKAVRRHHADGMPHGTRPAETLPTGGEVGDGSWEHGREIGSEDKSDRIAARRRGTWEDASADRFRQEHPEYIGRPDGKAELMEHLTARHGVSYSGDKAPGTRFLLTLHDRFHDGQTADRPQGGPHQHDVPGVDPVFGSRRQADFMSQPHQTTDDAAPPFNRPDTTPQPWSQNADPVSHDEQAGFHDGQEDALAGRKPAFMDNSSGVSTYVSGYARGYTHVRPDPQPDAGGHPGAPPQDPDVPRSMGGDSGQARNAEEAQRAFQVSKASRGFVTEAAAASTDFRRAYRFALKWKPGTGLPGQGSPQFEAGLYAGMTDNSRGQDAWIGAHRAMQGSYPLLERRMERHASFTDLLTGQGYRRRGNGVYGRLPVPPRTAGTTTDLITDGPGTSPDPMGSTPLNGPGTPPQSAGRGDPARPGGPPPYQGAQPASNGPVVEDDQAGRAQEGPQPSGPLGQGFSGPGPGYGNQNQVPPAQAHGVDLAPEAPNAAAAPGYSNPQADQGNPHHKAAAFRRMVQANLARRQSAALT